jgi:hypothetical protein
VGPYKFKGLPGCIVQLYDDQKIFNFELIQMKQRDNLIFKPYPSVLKKSFETTTRKDFNTFQQAASRLSFNELMSYMNRDKPGANGIKLVSQSDDPMLQNLATNKPPKTRFIEIDHIE